MKSRGGSKDAEVKKKCGMANQWCLMYFCRVSTRVYKESSFHFRTFPVFESSLFFSAPNLVVRILFYYDYFCSKFHKRNSNWQFISSCLCLRKYLDNFLFCSISFTRHLIFVEIFMNFRLKSKVLSFKLQGQS